MTIFQTFILCILLMLFLCTGCYMLWSGTNLLYQYFLKPDFHSNFRFSYIHNRKTKLSIPTIAFIQMFIGLPFLLVFLFFLSPTKWVCQQCDTYQVAMASFGRGNNDYYCINCNQRFEKVNRFRDGIPFYSVP